jgi:hypothetical protein
MPNYYFDHVHLISKNPVQTAEFYQERFNAEKVNETDLGNGRTVINLNLGGVTILISPPAADNAPTGLVHFGIRTDNLEEAVSDLKDNDVKFTQEIREINPEFRISFLVAPEDVSIELQQGTI